MTQPNLDDLLRIMVKERASDIILKSGGCPAMRVAGQIRFLGDTPLELAQLKLFLNEIVPESDRAAFLRTGACDIAVAKPGVGRFRCNAFIVGGHPGFFTSDGTISSRHTIVLHIDWCSSAISRRTCAEILPSASPNDSAAYLMNLVKRSRCLILR